MSQSPNGISVGSAVFIPHTRVTNKQTDTQTTLRATFVAMHATRPNNSNKLLRISWQLNFYWLCRLSGLSCDFINGSGWTEDITLNDFHTLSPIIHLWTPQDRIQKRRVSTIVLCLTLIGLQEAQLPQRDRATCHVSERMGVRKVTNSKSDQGNSRALAMMPFDRPHTIYY